MKALKSDQRVGSRTPRGRLPVLRDDAGQQAVADDVALVGAQHQALGLDGADLRGPEAGDAGGLGGLELLEAPCGADEGLGEAGLPEARVLAGHADLPAEGEVVADEDAVAGGEADGEGLVDGVADADGEGDALDDRGREVQGGEEAGAGAGHGQRLLLDGEAGLLQGGFDAPQHRAVRQRVPGAGGLGGLHDRQLVAGDELRAAVGDEGGR